MENGLDSVALASRPLASLLGEIGSTVDGLGESDAAARLARCGANDFSAVRRRPLWLQFLDRLHNPLLIILLLASGFSAAAGDLYSFAIVVVIVLVSVVLDFVQELRANTTIDDLRRSVALRAKVLRDGRECELPVERLVPGDVVRLVAGDLVPADGRLIEARDLFVNQALLTGEPYPVEKRAVDLPRAVDPGGATNTLFMGTSVISGTGRAVVLRTGSATLLGGMAHSLTAPPPPTDFEIGVRHFGLLILRVTVFLVLFVLLANVLFHRPWLESLMFAVALAVGLTPELLPMVVTVTLARGALRLAERKVIVKRLTALHNLGAMDVLCTDKTGTLTEARIQLVRHIDVQGRDSEEVFRLAWLNSHFESGIRSPLDDAILDHGQPDTVDWRKFDEVPFDFERRRVSVLLERGGEHRLIVKGAPEDVLSLSSHYQPDDQGEPRIFDAEARKRVQNLFEKLGEDGFRVLAIASRVVGPEQREARVTDETELVFAGFAAFLDPPKADAAAALHALAQAGVIVKILTGDNERVTRHVCRELGLAVTGLINGDEMRGMSEEALRVRLATVNVFCRLSPPQKQRVLLALKQRGHAVGFLGDGINDAAALHAADVGISVDAAADVAKDAASLILLEHDLSVIHGGVMEGRRTVENVTKYILMGSSSNFGNMLSMAGAALVLPFLPMLPIQVLLNNLLYDASEIGIPFDRVDPETITRPVRWNMALIHRFMLVLGPVSSLFDFLTFYVLLTMFGAGEALFQTGWFVESLATQVLIILIIRTRRSPLDSRPHPLLATLSVGMVLLGAALPLSPLGPLFGFVPLPPAYFAFLEVAVIAYLFLAEGIKRLFYHRFGRPDPMRKGA